MLNVLIKFITVILLISIISCTSNNFEADTVIINANVHTMEDASPLADAIAIWQDKIIAVGSDSEIKSYIGENTNVIDAEGKLVIPGFIDNHTHFVTGGYMLSEVRLKDAKTQEEFGERLAAKSRELPAGAWILGGTWDHDNWPDGELPTAELIDKYVPNRPVFVTRYDGHMSVANSSALKIAGINSRTKTPVGGVIVRKKNSNEPAGVLKDTAQDMMYRFIPNPSRAENLNAISAAVRKASSVGVTSVQDMNYSSESFNIYQELYDSGELSVRIDVRVALGSWKRLADFGFLKNFRSNDFIKIGGLKSFVDGSVGSTTALFYDPYVQDATTSGVYTNSLEFLRSNILEADKAGLHVAVHAIGDKANSELLDIFKEVIQINGDRDRRFRVEHAQHIDPKDFARFAEMGIIASVQPYHAIDDGRWVEKRIGETRTKTTYPFRQFLDNKVIMTFGSDWVVAPINPILGIDAAVTRRTTDGANPDGWYPEQKISVEEAVKAYTIISAYSAFDENIKGTIKVGKLADIIFLSQDIFTIPVNDIVNTEVVKTIVGGKVVYQK